MSEAFYVIANGAAGGGRARARSEALLDELRSAGVEVEVHYTEAPRHASNLAREAVKAGRRRFLSMGGDGTSYEIINGLFPRADGQDDPITLGIIPLGTGNSFLRDFEIADSQAAIQRIVRGDTHKCDVVKVTHRDGELHYLNILSIGFSAKVGDLTNRRFKPLGAAGYILAVLTSIAGLEHPVDPLRADGEEALDDRAATLLSFSNSKFTGGAMMMAPNADVTDGKLDFIRVGALSRPGLLRAFPKIFRGTHITLDDVEERLVERIEFTQEREQPVMIDGEVLDLALRSIEVIPSALEVLA